jgi:hypothetical protein
MARAAGPARQSPSSSRTSRASNSNDPVAFFSPSGNGIQARQYAGLMFSNIVPRLSGPFFA